MEQWTSEPLTLTYTHREKEYVAATRVFYGRVYHTRLIMVISSLGLSLGLVLILMNIEYIMGSMAAVLGFALLVLNFYAYFVTPGQHFRRSAKFQEEYSLVFSDEGLLFRSKDMESKLEWGFYSKVLETPKFYFLCYDKDMFTLIPKRVFTSKGQQSAFRDLLSRNITASFDTQELPGGERNEDYIPPQNPPDWR